MTKWKKIHDAAAKRHGGKDALAEKLPRAKSARALGRVKDDRCLSAMSKCIFRAGFSWKVVDAKWPGFEDAFGGFDIKHVATMEDEAMDTIAQNTAVIRNRAKLASVRENARYIAERSAEHGSFGKFLAKWPEDDVVGLWEELKKCGARLGGNTGPMFLREIGRDTFILSPDVKRALVTFGVVDSEPKGKRATRAVQDAFNGWREESGLSLCEMSMVVACSV